MPWAVKKTIAQEGPTTPLGTQTCNGGSTPQSPVDTAVAHERLTVWAIENGQHWVLDVQFGEDTHQARQKHFAENLALIRRMALNVIHHNGPSKDSLRCRKPRSSLNDDYRARLIFGPQFT